MHEKSDVLSALRTVIDPEMGLNIVDLGLVYGTEALPAGGTRIRLTMTTAACPLGELIAAQAKAAVEGAVPAAAPVTVEIVWDPPWHPGLMSAAAKPAVAAEPAAETGGAGFQRQRAPLLALGFACLVAGLAAGLARLGWPLAVGNAAALHGPLMVAGFLGTVIGLERAVALKARWAFVAPVAAGAGGVLALAGQPAGPILQVVSAAVLLAASLAVVRRQPALFTATMAVGAGCLLAGNAAWLAGRPPVEAVLWWMAFLVLTIAGERLDLSRILRPRPLAAPLFLAMAAVLPASAVIAPAAPALGIALAGAAMLALAWWFATFDVIRQTIRQPGLPRFVAVCLVIGYAWLAVAGLVAAAHGKDFAGPPYDAAVHAVFLGFAFAMIFGHAPIILPAVLGLAVRFHPAFYAPLALMTVGVALRVGGGLAGFEPVRQWSGIISATAIALFVAIEVAAVTAAGRGSGTRR